MEVILKRNTQNSAIPFERGNFITLEDALKEKINNQLGKENFSLEAILSYFSAYITAVANERSPKRYEALPVKNGSLLLIAAIYEVEGSKYFRPAMTFSLDENSTCVSVVIDVPFSVPDGFAFDSITEDGIVLKMLLETDDEEMMSILEKLKKV